MTGIAAATQRLGSAFISCQCCHIASFVKATQLSLSKSRSGGVVRENHQTKSNPNTMCPPITLGGNLGPGHFYLAKNRTFLLCVDTMLKRL
jgi:hypothetical protein